MTASAHRFQGSGRGLGLRVAKRDFKILSFGEVQTRPQPNWLVRDVLPASGLVMLYGPPNVGKTFLALDLAAAVASGQPWLGHATTLGDVTYVIAEGAGGFQTRLTAVESMRGLKKSDSDRLHFIDEPVQLHSPADVEGLLGAIRAQIVRPVVLIVFDTLSRCFAGCDENNAKEVSNLVQAADRIGKETGATVLLVHHPTKAGDAERGSSVLRGSVTTMLGVRKKAGVLSVECEKQKDAAPFAPIGGQLVSHAGSLVVDIATASVTGEASNVGLTPKGQQCLKALAAIEGVNGATAAEWEKESRLKPSTFFNYLKALGKQKYVTHDGSAYRLSEKGKAAITPTLALLSSHSG